MAMFVTVIYLEVLAISPWKVTNKQSTYHQVPQLLRDATVMLLSLISADQFPPSLQVSGTH